MTRVLTHGAAFAVGVGTLFLYMLAFVNGYVLPFEHFVECVTR